MTGVITGVFVGREYKIGIGTGVDVIAGVARVVVAGVAVDVAGIGAEGAIGPVVEHPAKTRANPVITRVPNALLKVFFFFMAALLASIDKYKPM
jgi:hypothetical protein